MQLLWKCQIFLYRFYSELRIVYNVIGDFNFVVKISNKNMREWAWEK
jgi:hypothetical protein